MIRPRRSFALFVALGAVTAFASNARAFVAMAAHWSTAQLPVHYRINEASAPASIGAAGARTAIVAGFASWSAPTCTNWRTVNDGTTTLAAAVAGDGMNSILFRSGTWPPELGAVGTVIGVTTPVYRTGGSFIDADIQFNNVGFRWSLTGASGTVDTQSIATHEEGHFLGLGHTPLSRAVMYASYSGGLRRVLDADDAMGVCAIYPAGTTTGCTVDTMCTTGQRCVMGSCQWVMTDAGSSGGALGDPCSMIQPCMPPNGCLVGSSGTGICSRMCSTASPCPTGFRCALTGAGNVCLPATNGAVGDPCMSGLDCVSNICLPRTSGGGFCSQVCIDSCTCPPAYTCSARGATQYCMPGLHDCSDDAGTPGPDVVDPPDDGVVPDMDTGVASDVPVATGDASRDAGRGDAGAGTMPRGCGCRTAGASSPTSLWSLVLALAIAGVGRRVRRRTSANQRSN